MNLNEYVHGGKKDGRVASQIGFYTMVILLGAVCIVSWTGRKWSLAEEAEKKVEQLVYAKISEKVKTIKYDPAITLAVMAASLKDSVIANQDGIIMIVSREVASLSGYTPQELVGKNVSELIPDRFKASHHAKSKIAIQTHEDVVRRTNCMLLTKNKNEIMINVGVRVANSDIGPIMVATIVQLEQIRTDP